MADDLKPSLLHRLGTTLLGTWHARLTVLGVILGLVVALAFPAGGLAFGRAGALPFFYVSIPVLMLLGGLAGSRIGVAFRKPRPEK